MIIIRKAVTNVAINSMFLKPNSIFRCKDAKEHITGSEVRLGS